MYTVHLYPHSGMTWFHCQKWRRLKPPWLMYYEWRGRDSTAQFEVSWTSIAFHTSPAHHTTLDYIFDMQANNYQVFQKKACLWRAGCNQRRRLFSCEIPVLHVFSFLTQHIQRLRHLDQLSIYLRLLYGNYFHVEPISCVQAKVGFFVTPAFPQTR